MKKLFSVFIAVALVMGVAMSASAATSVSVTLTSPTITKASATVCEKVGAVTFDFPAGAVVTAGDWWYMDLPEGATLCKALDYLIVGSGAQGPDTWVGVDAIDPTYVSFANVLNNLGDATGNLVATGADGPITVVGTGTTPLATTFVGNLALRVIGASGSRRVTLYVADNDNTVNDDTLTVGQDSVLRIKILDGQPHVNTVAAENKTSIIIDRDAVKFTTINGATTSTTGGYYRFGQMTTDTTPTTKTVKNEVIDTASYQVPHVENTLCVNAYNASGNLHVSFASKQDKFTFTGDSQIAHTGTAASISLLSCLGKTTTLNEIKIGTQNACQFDYETVGTGSATNNYCATHAAGKLYLSSTTVFGELDDRYDIQFTSLTNGVYFGGFPSMYGFLSSQDACAVTGTAITAATTDLSVGGVWKSTNSTLAYATSSACTVPAANRVNVIKTYGGAISGIQNYTKIAFDFANFYYDTSLIGAGTEAQLQVTLNKYPCGEIWTGTITVGTFVTTCSTTTTGTTSLFFPFLPGSAFVGWWGGYVVSNGGTTAGTAVLTATDVNGNAATYTTPSIPAKGQFNASFLTAADWTQAAGNTANFDGSANYTVSVTCNFTGGSGFAMLGNGTEGVGYTADK